MYVIGRITAANMQKNKCLKQEKILLQQMATWVEESDYPENSEQYVKVKYK